jgi:GT2 family glycosyltransferase
MPSSNRCCVSIKFAGAVKKVGEGTVSMHTDVSIIVCTYNRCDSLKMLMDSLEGLKDVSAVSWELIVVDNNSTDQTRVVVDGVVKAGCANVKYLFEVRRGKSFALNTGISAAKGEIIAFLDDDCIVTPGWLACLAKEFRNNPECAGIGGRVELYDSRDRPVTIRTSKKKQAFSSSGQLFSLIPGCNMAFIRTVFHQAGNFDVRFGPGTLIASAEDADFIYRVYKLGLPMLYCPDVVIYHNHGRRTDSQVAMLSKLYTIGRGSFYCKHILKGDFEILKMAYWEITTLMRNLSGSPRDRESRHKSREYLRNLFTGTCRYLTA